MKEEKSKQRNHTIKKDLITKLLQFVKEEAKKDSKESDKK